MRDVFTLRHVFVLFPSITLLDRPAELYTRQSRIVNDDGRICSCPFKRYDHTESYTAKPRR